MTKAIWQPAPVMTEHLGKAPPEYVWHYTDQNGLLGILQSKQLWASNARYLNDHQEFAFGVNLIRTHIAAMYHEHDVDTEVERGALLEEMLTRIRHLRPDTSAYVASWAAADDDLAQWRAYSGGGTGYAICMRGDVLKRLAEEQQFMFAECIYDPRDHARWVEEIVKTSFKEMIDDLKNGVLYERAGAGDKLLFRLLRYSPLFKHEKFSGEREWRLIAAYPGIEHGPTFAVRAGRSTVIPYVPFRLKTDSVPIEITEIVVGPCAEPALATSGAFVALQTYVKGNHKGSYRVRPSEVPHRNW